MAWNSQSGIYLPPEVTWQVDHQVEADESDLPDIWLSRPGGNYHTAVSFHFPPFTFPNGTGHIGNGIAYGKSPFFLHHIQDPYNSWNVKASVHGSSGSIDYWDWLPGIILIDETTRYTLPAMEVKGHE